MPFRDVLQPWHLLIILAIVLVLFGPRRLPEIGSAVGRTINEFKNSLNGDKKAASENTTTIEPPPTDTLK